MKIWVLLLILFALASDSRAIEVETSSPGTTAFTDPLSYIESLSKLTPADPLAFFTEWLKAALSMFAKFEESKLGYLKGMDQYLQGIIDSRFEL